MGFQLDLRNGEVKFLAYCDVCGAQIADSFSGVFMDEPLRLCHAERCAESLAPLKQWQPIQLLLDAMAKKL